MDMVKDRRGIYIQGIQQSKNYSSINVVTNDLLHTLPADTDPCFPSAALHFPALLLLSCQTTDMQWIPHSLLSC